ncbi:MAG TPA: SRPBCC family protein [Mycobacteriales bacterium]|nr:SRPBCC family protein [Mycobacteriales bacterium]
MYAYLADLARWPEWTFFEALTPRPDGRWDAVVPGGGRSVVTPARPNDLGVLDHAVEVSPEVTVQVGLRVVPNQDGSEVLFTAFRVPGMSDAEWADDVAAAEKDQAELKALLEKS